MTLGVVAGGQRTGTGGISRWCLGGALFLAIAVAVPPLSSLSHRYEFAQALQFSAYAMAIPALIVLGARWTGRITHQRGRRDEGRNGLSSDGRERPPVARGVVSLGLYLGAVVIWRTPVAVDALERDAWLVLLEAVTLIVFGTIFWSYLVGDRSFETTPHRLWRAVMAALAMWAVWVVAYLVGFSSSSWYPAFHHAAGRGVERDRGSADLNRGVVARRGPRLLARRVSQRFRLVVQRGPL